MKRSSSVWGVTAFVLFCLVIAQTAAGAATFPNDLLRPPSGGYFGPGTVNFGYGYMGRNLLLWQPSQSWAPPALGNYVTHYFNGTMRIDLSSDSGMTWNTLSASASEGIWTYHSSDPLPSTRMFEEEVTSLSWSGSGLMIRESPTKASSGHTTITQATGGDYDVSSFFDVWFEISIDGGIDWYPADASERADLMPEPSSFLALGSGLLALCGALRRRK